MRRTASITASRLDRATSVSLMRSSGWRGRRNAPNVNGARRYATNSSERASPGEAAAAAAAAAACRPFDPRTRLAGLLHDMDKLGTDVVRRLDAEGARRARAAADLREVHARLCAVAGIVHAAADRLDLDPDESTPSLGPAAARESAAAAVPTSRSELLMTILPAPRGRASVLSMPLPRVVAAVRAVAYNIARYISSLIIGAAIGLMAMLPCLPLILATLFNE